MTTDLKPCPFCGDPDPVLRDINDPSVACEACGAEGPPAIDTAYDSHAKALDGAVELWNMRAGEAAPTTKGN